MRGGEEGGKELGKQLSDVVVIGIPKRCPSMN